MSEASPKVLVVIPARYASTRFPGKPLVDINGKPMLQHVWEKGCALAGVERVIIATDDKKIEAACKEFGAEVVMTSPKHPSGTDRVWEVAEKLPEYDWVLNIQGDEPQINPDDLQKAIGLAQSKPETDLITLVSPIESLEDFADPNIVKAILSLSGQALYFSRQPIPYDRESPETGWQKAYRHIGVYLYKRTALARMTALPPSPLECQEKLEQLRALEDGLRIMAVTIAKAPVGIDTPEDLKKLNLAV